MATYYSNTYEGRRLRLEIWQDGGNCCWQIFSEGGKTKYYTIYNPSVSVNGTKVWNPGYTPWDSYEFPAAVGNASGRVWIGNGASSKTIPIVFTGSVYTSSGSTNNRAGNFTMNPYIFTPTLSAVSISNITRTSAKASFSVTNNGGQAIVDNHIDCSLTNFGSAVKTINGTSGSFSGLSPNTKYYVRANASNGAARGYSSVGSFTTTGNAPIINSTSASPSRTDCTISHNTSYDTNASYKSISIKYGKTTSYGSTATSTSLSGLTPNTLYYYSVTITDNWNRTSAAKTGSFTTTGNPPVAEKIEVLDITRTSARLNMWGTYDTNAVWEEADYTYGIVEGEYTQTTGSVMENLEPNTTYYIKARFKDNWDRWSNYVYNSFTTIGNAPSNIVINLDNIGETNVELTVSAEPDTNATIEEYAIYQDDSILVDYQAYPIFNIDNLQEETEYNIVAKAKDNWNRIGTSEVTTFITLAGKWIKIINTNGEITTHKCYLITPAEKIEIKKDAFKILGG